MDSTLSSCVRSRPLPRVTGALLLYRLILSARGPGLLLMLSSSPPLSFLALLMIMSTKSESPSQNQSLLSTRRLPEDAGRDKDLVAFRHENIIESTTLFGRRITEQRKTCILAAVPLPSPVESRPADGEGRGCSLGRKLCSACQSLRSRASATFLHFSFPAALVATSILATNFFSVTFSKDFLSVSAIVENFGEHVFPAKVWLVMMVKKERAVTGKRGLTRSVQTVPI